MSDDRWTNAGRAVLESARLLARGILRRWFYWAPTLLLDPFDWYDRWLKPLLPPRWQVDIMAVSAPVATLIFVLFVMGAVVLTYHELRLHAVGLERSLQPRIEIAFDDRPEYARMTSAQDHSGGAPRQSMRVYLVGVRNLSEKTIEGVRVILTDLDPRPNGFTPGELQLDGGDPDGKLARQGISLYPIQAGSQPAHFFEVVAKDQWALREDVISIRYADPQFRRSIPSGRHIVTLIATGNGVDVPTRRRFSVKVEDHTRRLTDIDATIDERLLLFTPEDAGS